MKPFIIKNIDDFKEISHYQFIDCSYYLPNEEKRHFNETPKITCNDIFFDLDKVANKNSLFKHMFPPKNIFLEYCGKNRINHDKHYIFYDHKGIFSAPRVYFTFLAYGFDKISVLDGGYLTAQQCAFQNIPHDNHHSHYTDDFILKDLDNPLDLFVNSDYVKQGITDNRCKIIDARPSGRFHGIVPEPREGLLCGHIPNSINLPFTDLLTAQKTFKPITEMADILHKLGIRSDDTLIFTCGSGITACVVAFAALMCGFDIGNIKIYDASWCEWGNGDFDVVTS